MQVLPAPDRVTTIIALKPSRSACPLCGTLSARIHSCYTRILADLPWQGRTVVVRIRARRFRCAAAGCPRQIFAERLPEVARPRGRRTARLADIQRHIGFALGGEPGMPASGDTLLRLIRAAELEPHPPPRVIGIDDWAWRRGQRYGTIVCDLERGQVVDLLPGRNAEAVASWLCRHPGVEVVARDRAGVYAEGSSARRLRSAAPGQPLCPALFRVWASPTCPPLAEPRPPAFDLWGI